MNVVSIKYAQKVQTDVNPAYGLSSSSCTENEEMMYDNIQCHYNLIST